jgi:hypothetical protein
MQLDLFDELPDDPAPRAPGPVAPPAFPEHEDPAHLRSALERQSGMTVDLVVTDNSSTVLSVKHQRRGRAATLRVHHMFLTAPAPVVQALASWLTLRKNKRAAEVINTYIRDQKHAIRERRARRVPVRMQGEHFDLAELFDEVNAASFGGEITARITWGRFPSQARRRSVTFGSYSQHDHLIRISKLLDLPFVPRYFIRFIVFHEMLHAHLGIGEYPSGRRCIHGRAFREREQAYPDYHRAVAWQEKNLHRFLRLPPAIWRGRNGQ